MDAARGGLTAALLDQVDALGDPPPAVVRWARHSLIDWMGCAVAGSGDPLVGILVDELAPGEVGEAGLLGRRARTGAHTAALINGAASHALDFDDTNMAMGGHPSVPVLPAVLALGERVDASGEDLLRALVAGMETQARVGLVVNPGHYAAGFHTTATVGTFGAAAACGRLLGLDVDQRLHSLGIAGTQAAGLKAVFGTMCKPLHAGKAAANGLLAATLAARGFTSATDIVETTQGFAATHAAGDGADERLAAARDRWFTAETLYKVHAACHLTHAAIEAAGRLRTGEPIERVDVQVHPMCIGVCDIDMPRTGLEGKFSLRATVAMALLGWDTTDPATFTEPVNLTQYWLWLPSVKLLPYECALR